MHILNFLVFFWCWINWKYLLGHFGDFLDTLLLWGTTCARVNSLFTGVISLSVYVKVKLPLMTSLCPIKGHVNTQGDTRFCKLFHSFHETWNLWTGWRIYLPESGVSRKLKHTGETRGVKYLSAVNSLITAAFNSKWSILYTVEPPILLLSGLANKW